jgi:uncharacterized membrane protein (DUF373 family)
MRAMARNDGGTRGFVARGFTWVEDLVYVALGALLAVAAVLSLGSGAVAFVRQLSDGPIPQAVVGLLDRLLLTLMIVELLYTVQVSFREHALVPEPFLIVGLVAATRRILVLTAEFGSLATRSEEVFRASMIELGVLTLMIVAFVASLLMLRNRHPGAVASRA